MVLSLAGSPRAQDDYRLGVRDVLSLTIFAGGRVEHKVDLTVSPEGTISVPFLGQVQAKGLAVRQVEEHIQKILAADYFVNPIVNIRVLEYHSLRYFISGAVHHPGAYKTSSPASLMELIAKAGGELPERGNIAYVFSPGQEKDGVAKDPVKVDLKKLLDQGDPQENLTLKSGDVVYIPMEESLDQTESKIYVEGQVKSPGVFDFWPGMTALAACIAAGGFDKFAAPNRASIVRMVGDERKIITINLNEVKKGKQADVELKPGDRIHIPESWL